MYDVCGVSLPAQVSECRRYVGRQGWDFGDEMQDVFFFVKEAIETYFAGTVFPVTMVVGLLRGEKPRS